MQKLQQFTLIAVMLISSNIWAGEVTITDSFVAGESATAASVNTKFGETGSAINDNNTRITALETRITNLEGVTSNISDFAPADADAFETKFVNRTTTYGGGGITVTFQILSSKMFKLSITIPGTDGTDTVETATTSYTYNNTSLNIATISYTISYLTITESCTDTWIFTSALSGSVFRICDGVPQGNLFGFIFDGSN